MRYGEMRESRISLTLIRATICYDELRISARFDSGRLLCYKAGLGTPQ